MTMALIPEGLFLALTVAADIARDERSRSQVILMTGALAILFLIGSLIALPIEMLPPAIRLLVIGLIALHCLVTEELLVDALDTSDKPWVTAMFFCRLSGAAHR